MNQLIFIPITCRVIAITKELTYHYTAETPRGNFEYRKQDVILISLN